MDAKEIGIKLQGSLRPLVVRAEDLSWARCNDCTDPSAAKVQTPKEEADKPVSMEDGEHDDIGRDDVVMSFQLRPGSYALEAMRELMK
jgi:tRNA(Glu) U13 pseudouridine synthase TruD